jgi:hypothetical protein
MFFDYGGRMHTFYQTKRKVFGLFLMFFISLLPSIPAAENYYVDSDNGSDKNSGLSPDNAWKTFNAIHSHDFAPGDVIHLRRGGKWSGTLTIDDNGTSGQPIGITAYGEGSERPEINGMSGERGVIIEGSWVVVEGLLVHNTHQEGVSVRITAPHAVVRNLEITDTGFGIYTRGDSGLFTKNYLHDLHMVNNTKNEGDGDDDYGAAGIVFDSCASNEASYNVAERCIAPSYDYGVDGGFFETWLDVSGSYVHHNLAIDCDGFLEVGGQGSLVRDTRIAYNISVNNGRFAWFHLGGKFGVEIKNFRVENNTIVNTNKKSRGQLIFKAMPDSGEFIVHNNIFYVDDYIYRTYKDSDGLYYGFEGNENFIHNHNLYQTPVGVGVSLGQGEIIADPLFVNFSAKDFHLSPNSPAIDAGVDLGYSIDFDSKPVPAGNAPDIGAYEVSE